MQRSGDHFSESILNALRRCNTYDIDIDFNEKRSPLPVGKAACEIAVCLI